MSRPATRVVLRWRGVDPVFAQRGTLHGSGLGQVWYLVEQTITVVHQNRRLKARYDNRREMHQAIADVCWHQDLLVPTPYRDEETKS